MAGVWLLLLALTACALPSPPLSAPAARTSLSPSPRLALAYAYYQNGQYRVALDETHKLLRIQADDPQALGLQGLIYARLNEPALAQRSFLQADRSGPLEANIAHNHGLFLCEQGQFVAAFDRFDQAVQQALYVDKAKTLWVWGVCEQSSGDEIAAQNLWIRSLSLEPSAPAALALAKSYEKQNWPTRAQSVLAQFNTTAAVTPATLWLGIQWARKSADELSIKRYAAQLHQLFPSSSQWHAYQREAFDE
jgi:type IV pilus assembly protein PilF